MGQVFCSPTLTNFAYLYIYLLCKGCLSVYEGENE